MNITDYFSNLVLTKDQNSAILAFEKFLNSNNRIFLLKGYAGTGKTTLIRGILKYLQTLNIDFRLMAPTGRAAKIVKDKTGEPATTIHRGIYSFSDMLEIKTGDDKDDISFLYQYKVGNVATLNSVIIIDEASMLSDINSGQEFFRFGSGNVLEDLVHYSKINDLHYKTKIIFVGDSAQLPPIGMNFSPALDESYLIEKYKIAVESVELKEVKRLDKDNNILHKATKIRQGLLSGYYNEFDLRDNGKDIFNVDIDNFIDSYKDVIGKKIVLSFKNSTQNYVNKRIRIDKYGSDLPVQKGDVMIVGKNNYKLDLLNGEFALVSEVSSDIVSRSIRFNKKGGKGDVILSWRKISLIVRDDLKSSREVSGFLLENYLYGDGDLTSEEVQGLYVDFMMRHPGLKRGDQQFAEMLKNDVYFNALMLKYGYAITGHKAQGGEWDNVFVFWDKGITKGQESNEDRLGKIGKSNADFYRWAYTAITRSSRNLYCLEPPYFSPYSSMYFADYSMLQELDVLDADLKEKNIDLLYSEEIELLFKNFDLEACDTNIQDHFLSIWYQLKDSNITILSQAVKNYEVHYQFTKESETAGLKFWFNDKKQFKAHFQTIQSLTNSLELFETISQLLCILPNINLVRKDIDSIDAPVQRDFITVVSKPFLNNLNDELERLVVDSGIQIESVDHLNYKERYSFGRGKEKVVLDIDYNGQGFFGRAYPLAKSCNSQLLIKDLQGIIDQLKNKDYVFQRD